MITSEKTEALWPALFRAQGEFAAPKKNRVNPHFKNRYADLAEMMDAVKPALRSHGLVLMQDAKDGVLETSVIHAESAQWVRWSVPLCVDGMTPQQQGSAITYARRYSLGLIGLVAEDDDDGEATRKADKDQQAQPQRFGGKPAALQTNRGNVDHKALHSDVTRAYESGPLTKEGVGQIHRECGSPQIGTDGYVTFHAAVMRACEGVGVA